MEEDQATAPVAIGLTTLQQTGSVLLRLKLLDRRAERSLDGRRNYEVRPPERQHPDRI